MRKLLVLFIASFALTSGCIANMSDLKERLGADDTLDTAVLGEPLPLPPAPPVARMRIGGPAGVLFDEGSADRMEPLLVKADDALTFQAVAGPNLTRFTWTIAGMSFEGAHVSLNLGKAGLFPVVLTVLDARNASDNQTVVLAVAPEPLTQETPFTTGPVAGAQQVGQKGVATFTLDAAASGVPNAKVVAFVVTLNAPDHCDLALDVLDPTGTSLGKVNEAGAGEAETRTLEAPFREGAYTIEGIPVACLAHEGVTGTVSVTFLEHVPGLEAAQPAQDGHGGHAH